jgi:hypothetical protein
MDIDITGVMLPELVKEVYNLSSPQGLGALHFKEGGLTNEEVNEVLDTPKYSNIVVSMDYIKGRACKMAVYKKDDSVYIRYPWFDHTHEDFVALLKAVWPEGKPFPELEHLTHNPSCNCTQCRDKRTEGGE